MTDLSAEFKALAEYRPTNKVRFVTAAALFDGHDAAINIMRRILQGMGAEVIHLGHNRSVDEVVTAALQEDAQGIAISSYQGGHVEYFKYMIDLLRQRGGERHPGVRRRRRRDRAGRDRASCTATAWPASTARKTASAWACRHDRRDGDALRSSTSSERAPSARGASTPMARDTAEGRAGARWRSSSPRSRTASADAELRAGAARTAPNASKIPVLGITGTGGAGKSSLTDELIRRIRLDQGDRAAPSP